MSFWGWLQLLLIGAKLFGAIDWSWWVVLIPLWIGCFFAVLLASIVVKK